MKLILALESLSTIKRTPQAQAAATKSFPKTAALIHKLSVKIKLLKKEALKAYFKRKKDDAVKEAHKKSAPHKSPAAKPAVPKTDAAKPVAARSPKPKKSHSSALVVLSAEIEDRLFDQETDISDDDLAECCTFESTSAVSVQTAIDKKKQARHLKNVTKNPKAALRKKQMSAAMRIRENKKRRIEIKKLLGHKRNLQDKAWRMYLAKMTGKKVAKKVAKPLSAKLVDKEKPSSPATETAVKPTPKKIKDKQKPKITRAGPRGRKTVAPKPATNYLEVARKKTIDACTAFAKDAGFNISDIEFPSEGHKFKVGDIEYTSGGDYDPNTGKINIVVSGRHAPQQLVAILSHEVQHHKYDTVKAAYDKEIDRRSDADLEKYYDSEMNLKPEHADEFAKRFPTIHALKATRFNRGRRKQYEESDGCTPYSTAYWENVTDDFHSRDTAFNETLAEVAKLDYKGKLAGKTLAEMGVKPEWEELYGIYNSAFSSLQSKDKK